MNDKLKALLAIILALFFLAGCSSAEERDRAFSDAVDMYDESDQELANILAEDYNYEDVSSSSPAYEINSTDYTDDITQAAPSIKISEPLVIAAAVDVTRLRQSPVKETKIKIVSGDGMPLSAKRLSRILQDKGYDIDRIDVAPYTFDKIVVFYAKGFELTAQKLANEVNADGGIKPINWKSVYDIIIVSIER